MNALLNARVGGRLVSIIAGAIGGAHKRVLARLRGHVVFRIDGEGDRSGLVHTRARLVLAAIALATLVPAWGAARTNPLTALRHQ